MIGSVEEGMENFRSILFEFFKALVDLRGMNKGEKNLKDLLKRNHNQKVFQVVPEIKGSIKTLKLSKEIILKELKKTAEKFGLEKSENDWLPIFKF